MGERASFVTEYIHCAKCLTIAKAALLGEEKTLCSVQIPSWQGTKQPDNIIAGRLSTTTINGEWMVLQEIIMEKMMNKICHPIRIALIGEDRQGIVTAYPKDWPIIDPAWDGQGDN